jgi:ribonuclease R
MRPRKKQKEENLIGKLQLHSDGYGFVVQERGKKPDIFIPPHAIAGAMNGDKVEVSITRRKGEKRWEGQILKIIERGKKQLVGQLEGHPSGFFVICEDKRNPLKVKIPSEKIGSAVKGQSVVVKITQFPEGKKPLTGEIIQVLGERGEAKTEVEVTIAEHNLRTQFPPPVLEEAKTFDRKVSEKECSHRNDLRNLPIVTIDGENAKDFDDGILVQKTNEGYRLFVAIADVSNYVTPQTALNGEAYQRSTSVYFPDRCIPMLPEELSNHLCSLVPHQDRLSFAAEIDFDKRGVKTGATFYKAVMRSAARLTYTIVKRMMIDLDVALRAQFASLIPHLEVAFELFELLRARRLARGSIDFDLPEPEIILDVEEGIATSILKAPRTPAHMLIEEFMIAANEAVAEHMADRDLPMVYRIHERPDLEKITDFKMLAHSMGHALPPVDRIHSKDLARIVGEARGKPYERLINTVLLRSLKQAIYSTQNVGHFGLASKKYTHFTSPIRRYPDLIVHRVLHDALDMEGKKKPKKDRENQLEKLAEIADHCSKMERIAMQAEWDVRDLQVALFMKDKLGEEYEGIISSVTRFGFFVELLTYFVEGLVHINTLNDVFEFDEKHHELRGRVHKKRYRIGDRVRIQVAKVNIEQRKLDFNLT